jgi:hypothetical protein
MRAGLEGNSRPVGAVDDLTLATVLKVFEHERIVAAMQALPERWRTVLWYAEVRTYASGNTASMSLTAARIIGLISLSVSLWSVRRPGAQEIRVGAKTTAQRTAIRWLFMCSFGWLQGLDRFDRVDDSMTILAFHVSLVLEIALARPRALEAVPVMISEDDVFVDERSGRLGDLHAVGQFACSTSGSNKTVSRAITTRTHR